jgi:diguanylate cyclase (GGDEF)-like protein
LNLRTKTFLLIFGLASALIVLIAGTALRFQEQTIRANVLVAVDALARASSVNVASFMRYGMQDAVMLAASLDTTAIVDETRRPALYDALAQMAHRVPRFDNGVFLLDKKGRSMADYPRHPELAGRTFVHRDYFKQVLSTLLPAAGEPYVSSRTGRPVLTFAVPIFDPKGELIAVLGCSVNLLGQDGIGGITNQTLGDSGYIFIFDRLTRLMISHPDPARLLQRDVPEGANALLDQGVNGFEGVGETVNSRGVPMLMGVRAVPDSSWLVIAQMPQFEALAPMRQSRQVMLGIVAGAWLLAILLSFWVSRQLGRPITKLQEAALAVCESLPPRPGHKHPRQPGKLLHRFVTRKDEIGALARTFDELTWRLDDEISALNLAAHELHSTFDAVTIPLFRLAPDLTVLRCNRAASDWLRQPESALVNQTLLPLLFPHARPGPDWPDLSDFSTVDRTHEQHWVARLPGSERQLEFSATPILGDQSQPTGLVLAVRDITERLQEAAKIRSLAFLDPLTGLANRLLLADRLDQALALARRHAAKAGLMYLDLDHFKTINDTHGHGVGDDLLRAVSTRLQECLRTSDTLARIGGDEFVIVLAELSSPEEAIRVAQRIVSALALPFELGKVVVQTSSSIGIAIHPEGGDDAQTLTIHADQAMYQAKRQGRNAYVLYHTSSPNASSALVQNDDEKPSAP